jgi:hypothetical protein
MAAIVTAPPAGSTQADASAYRDRRRKAAPLVVALAFVMDLMDRPATSKAGLALGVDPPRRQCHPRLDLLPR